MTIRHTRRVFLTAATSVAVVLAATACGSPQDTASGGGDAAAPVKVGLVYSQSGPLASYGKQYIEGFKAGLALLWETRDRVPSAVPALAVHDEVCVEVDACEAEAARAWLVESLTGGMASVLKAIPIVVEVTIAADWSGTPVDGAGETV